MNLRILATILALLLACQGGQAFTNMAEAERSVCKEAITNVVVENRRVVAGLAAAVSVFEYVEIQINPYRNHDEQQQTTSLFLLHRALIL